MATETIRPNGQVENDQSLLSGWNVENPVSTWNDDSIEASVTGTTGEAAVNAWLTLDNTSVLTSADTINSVQLFVYGRAFKVEEINMNLLLNDADGALGTTHKSQNTTFAGAAYYGFTDSSVSWTKSIIDNMSLGFQIPGGSEQSIQVYEAYVVIDFTPAVVSDIHMQLTSGLVQLTAGKISL